jgi:hypothetical protein
MRPVRKRSVPSSPAPSWRRSDVRALQPGWLVAALLLLAMLLLEVWQQSAVASLSVRAGRASDLLKRASNDLEWTRAQLDENTRRAEVGSLAFSVGVRPADAAQVVWLPADYLEEDGVVAEPAGSPALLAAAGRALQSLVPEAKARGRHVD